MMQALLLDIGPKARRRCPICDGPIKAGRCRPCQKDTPAIGGPAWHRWTRGIDRVVRARLDAAGLSRLWADTWEALLLDTPMPAAAAPLVADIARLPFSPKRYQRFVDRAVTASQLIYILARGGVRREADDERDPVRDIAAVAAERMQVQEDRRAAGEVFERVHDAEILHEAVLEHRARKALRRAGLRGQALERAVRARVEREMAPLRGSWGRPSDEYPRDARIEVTGLRVAAPEDEDAALEAAEDEAAVPRRGRAG